MLRKKARNVCPLLAFFFFLIFPCWGAHAGEQAKNADVAIRIYDWKNGELLAEGLGHTGEELFFGWIHSWEKIPWNEYFRIADDCSLTLEAITFPAFGAGIPENKGTRCFIENGLIHMEGIAQRFEELVWLNSESATQEIRIGGRAFTRGSSLPHHKRLRLVVERINNATER